MRRTVVIDCFPSSVFRYVASHAIVAVDIIRATSMIVSAVAAGWRCFPVSTHQQALALSKVLPECLLAGELGGQVPNGFEMNNSPAQLAQRRDNHRPLVLLSTSGTDLVCRAGNARAAYPACFRNYLAVASYVARNHQRVAVIGAGSRDEFREEDQICCARVAEVLLAANFAPENDKTVEVVGCWKSLPLEACLVSNSVGYLRRSNQLHDLDFIFSHVDDLPQVFVLSHGEVVPAEAEITARCA